MRTHSEIQFRQGFSSFGSGLHRYSIQHEATYPVGEDASLLRGSDADGDQLSPRRVKLRHGVLENRGQLPAAEMDTPKSKFTREQQPADTVSISSPAEAPEMPQQRNHGHPLRAQGGVSIPTARKAGQGSAGPSRCV